MSDRLQAGPCVICGGTNYNLSCGGPTICPKCDCGNFDPAALAATPAVDREALKDARIALCERLVKYSDDIHCIAVHRDLANDLREAEACITLLADAAPPASPLRGRDEDWRDDPSADERWNAGVDCAMKLFCDYLGVDPNAVTWDAATETVDGDVRAVIGNILRAKMGEDWSPLAVQPASPLRGRESVRQIAHAPQLGDRPQAEADPDVV